MRKMQKEKASNNNGLQRYQIQHYRGLIRSLELEYRYKQKQLQLQQRQFLRSRSNLSLFHCSSQGNRSKSSYTAILPTLKVTPTISGGRRTPRINQETTLEKMNREQREPLDLLMDGFYEEETTDWKATAKDKLTWATLTFADIKQRQAARMQSLQPFMKWQHQLLSPQGFPGMGSPQMELLARTHGFYSPQLSGALSNKSHKDSIFTGKK